jgi:Domain of unknown function (DUF4232)
MTETQVVGQWEITQPGHSGPRPEVIRAMPAAASNHPGDNSVSVGDGLAGQRRPAGAAEVIIMRAPCPLWAAGLAAAIAASITGCAQAALTSGPDTAPPAPSATTLTASSSPPAPTRTASTSVAGAPVCRGSQLKIRLIYGGPAAGTVGGVIGLTNEGSRPCHLAGWPTVVAVSPAGTARARRTLNVFGATTLTTPPVVTISPGARAVAVLTAHDQPAPGLTKCPPAYQRLLITPPGSTHASVVSARIPNFTYLPACTPIQVSPLVPVSAVPYLRLHHA